VVELSATGWSHPPGVLNVVAPDCRRWIFPARRDNINQTFFAIAQQIVQGQFAYTGGKHVSLFLYSVMR